MGKQLKKTIHIGFKIPKQLDDFIKEQMEKNFQDKTEYLKTLILNEMKRVNENLENSSLKT